MTNDIAYLIQLLINNNMSGLTNGDSVCPAWDFRQISEVWVLNTLWEKIHLRNFQLHSESGGPYITSHIENYADIAVIAGSQTRRLASSTNYAPSTKGQMHFWCNYSEDNQPYTPKVELGQQPWKYIPATMNVF